MKRLIAPILMLSLLAGCATTPTGATTQPSLATLTTQTEAGLDVAVNSITIGRQLGVIPDDVFFTKIAPAVLAARAATKQMEDAVKASDQSSWQTASNIVTAALEAIQPYVAQANAAKAKQP